MRGSVFVVGASGFVGATLRAGGWLPDSCGHAETSPGHLGRGEIRKLGTQPIPADLLAGAIAFSTPVSQLSLMIREVD